MATTPIPFSVRVVDSIIRVGRQNDFTVVVQNGTIRVANIGGPPGPEGPPGPGITGLATTTINGQPTLTLVDTTRGSKVLSVAEQVLAYSENKLGDQDWIQPGAANDADSGYTADLDGTIVFCSAHCENTGANSKDIHLYVNGVDQGSVGTLSGGANATFTNTTLDLNFAQSDRIRARAEDGSGKIGDTVVKVTVKWRG